MRTMTVTVFDRAAEGAAWGMPRAGAVLRTVTVAATCPRCGGPRGEVRSQRQRYNDEWYTISRWENPCGHVDGYHAVLAEADAALPYECDKHPGSRYGDGGEGCARCGDNLTGLSSLLDGVLAAEAAEVVPGSEEDLIRRRPGAVAHLTPATSSAARTELAALLVEYGIQPAEAQAIAGCAEGAGLLRG